MNGLMQRQINPTGTVFDIQRYSLHDGPGIRSVVFLKGCTLHCRWCANPESLSIAPQLYYASSRCINCGACGAAAPGNSIQKTKSGQPNISFATLNKNVDFSWLSCCPTGALSLKGKKMQASEVLMEVMRDEIFYRHSGHGGVTLSGGEPLLQPEFSAALLHRVKNEVLSTAVETTGNLPYSAIEAVHPYTDLFLFDLKHHNGKQHQQGTGVPHDIILENLRKLAASGANILVRTPLIPGFNDSEKDIGAILDILEEAGIQQYALLPFHQYGSGKYAALGLSYEMEGLPPPEDVKVEALRALISARGFSSTPQKGCRNGVSFG